MNDKNDPDLGKHILLAFILLLVMIIGRYLQDIR